MTQLAVVIFVRGRFPSIPWPSRVGERIRQRGPCGCRHLGYGLEYPLVRSIESTLNSTKRALIRELRRLDDPEGSRISDGIDV